jgi:hypothetical protein
MRGEHQGYHAHRESDNVEVVDEGKTTGSAMLKGLLATQAGGEACGKSWVPSTRLQETTRF